jgi:ABC-2 type transport system ATP-binding protein
VILAENIYKKFNEPVLKGVTLEAEPGEIIGIAGENGSGKSTLLSIITGLLAPDSGKVNLERSLVGYVPQEAALFDNLTVKDNLRFWAAAYSLSWKDVLPELPSDMSSDAPFLKKKVRSLSGGMKKRLSIALACLHRPKWLVMDEPSSALDIGFKGALFEMFQDIRADALGRGVIFTSHQPDELMWCDRIYILRGGLFVYEGSPRELDGLPAALYGERGRKNDSNGGP